MILRLNGPMIRRLQDVDLSDIASFTLTDVPYWDSSAPNVLVVPVDTEPTDAQVEQIVTRLTTASTNEETLIDRAKQAVVTNNEFLAKPSPTNAEIVAQVKFLTRVVSALIRLVLRKLDGTD